MHSTQLTHMNLAAFGYLIVVPALKWLISPFSLIGVVLIGSVEFSLIVAVIMLLLRKFSIVVDSPKL